MLNNSGFLNRLHRQNNMRGSAMYQNRGGPNSRNLSNSNLRNSNLRMSQNQNVRKSMNREVRRPFQLDLSNNNVYSLDGRFSNFRGNVSSRNFTPNKNMFNKIQSPSEQNSIYFNYQNKKMGRDSSNINLQKPNKFLEYSKFKQVHENQDRRQTMPPQIQPNNKHLIYNMYNKPNRNDANVNRRISLDAMNQIGLSNKILKSRNNQRINNRSFERSSIQRSFTENTDPRKLLTQSVVFNKNSNHTPVKQSTVKKWTKKKDSLKNRFQQTLQSLKMKESTNNVLKAKNISTSPINIRNGVKNTNIYNNQQESETTLSTSRFDVLNKRNNGNTVHNHNKLNKSSNMANRLKNSFVKKENKKRKLKTPKSSLRKVNKNNKNYKIKKGSNVKSNCHPSSQNKYNKKITPNKKNSRLQNPKYSMFKHNILSKVNSKRSPVGYLSLVKSKKYSSPTPKMYNSWIQENKAQMKIVNQIVNFAKRNFVRKKVVNKPNHKNSKFHIT